MNINKARLIVIAAALLVSYSIYEYYKPQEPHIESLANAICNKIDSDKGVNNYSNMFEITLKVPVEERDVIHDINGVPAVINTHHMKNVNLYGYYRLLNIELEIPWEMFDNILKNHTIKFNFRNTLRIHRHMADWNTRKNERIDILNKQDITLVQQKVTLLDSLLQNN